jgi:hypothetical protein
MAKSAKRKPNHTATSAADHSFRSIPQGPAQATASDIARRAYVI